MHFINQMFNQKTAALWRVFLDLAVFQCLGAEINRAVEGGDQFWCKTLDRRVFDTGKAVGN